MRRVLATLVAGLLLALSATATAPAAKTPATVVVEECLLGEGAGEARAATFRGEMNALRGTGRMWMKFRLLERAEGAARYRAVSAPGLGVWRKSKPGVAAFAYSQRVLALRGGSSYRALVQFRWVRKNGEVQRRTSRRSGVCRQPGVLPNLQVVDLRSGPGPRADTAAYTVEVTNAGASEARDVRVSLRVDGAPVDSLDIASLPAGESRNVSFTGPLCARNVVARIDPVGTVKESDESDNTLARGCPL